MDMEENGVMRWGRYVCFLGLDWIGSGRGVDGECCGFSVSRG